MGMFFFLSWGHGTVNGGRCEQLVLITLMSFATCTLDLFSEYLHVFRLQPDFSQSIACIAS